jgi:hypothetical protein
MRRLVIATFFLIVHHSVKAQNSKYYALELNWKYLPWLHEEIFSPKYLGPNALPVPETVFGKIDGNMAIESRAVSHNAIGDQTENIYLRFAYPVVKDVVSLEVTDIFEHYNLSPTAIITHKNPESLKEGYMAGDINVTTIVQAVHNKSFPDMIIRVNLRSASGKNRQSGRFTDAPGYFFDASFSKGINFENKIITHAGLYASAGFYCWQTNDDFHPQDDAALGSFGTYVNSGKLQIKSELAGYYGYVDDGDRPLVSRTSVHYRSNKVTYSLQYQTGIHDFVYKTLAFGLTFFFDAPSLPVHSENRE